MITTANDTAPHPFLTFSEGLRSTLEFSSLFAAWPILWAAPRGDGSKVMVLPGFSLDNASTLLLRSYLTWLGYDVHGFEAGRNFGRRTLGHGHAALYEMIDAVAKGEPISLVGHSLGGVLAREYARRHPGRVRQVICLGSPFTGDERSMPAAVVWLRRALTDEDTSIPPDRSPMPVPHTVIYSNTDGVVAGFDCRHDCEGSDNVEVVGSHLGLVHNAAAFRIIAERLARPAPEAVSQAA